jgi:hypothetical protein
LSESFFLKLFRVLIKVINSTDLTKVKIICQPYNESENENENDINCREMYIPQNDAVLPIEICNNNELYNSNKMLTSSPINNNIKLIITKQDQCQLIEKINNPEKLSQNIVIISEYYYFATAMVIIDKKLKYKFLSSS